MPTFEMTNAVLPNGQEIDLLQAIINGTKVVDVQAATTKYTHVRIGDIVMFRRIPDGDAVMFRKIPEQVEMKIAMISGPSPNLTELLFWITKDCGLNSIETAIAAIIPGVHDIDTLEQVLNSFPDYPGKIKEYGLIAFALKSMEKIKVIEPLLFKKRELVLAV